MSNRVEAVDRALSILDAFASGRAVLSLKDVAEATGLYKSTILRLCGSLEAFGYIRRGQDGLFRLGPKLWQLGNQYQHGFNLEVYVRPVLRQIVDDTNETASFFIRDKSDRVCLFRENSRQPIRHAVEEGLRLPLDRGAAGRILRAFHDDAVCVFVETFDGLAICSTQKRFAPSRGRHLPLIQIQVRRVSGVKNKV